MANKIRIYMDASPISEDRFTGIPHFTAEMARHLNDRAGKDSFEVILAIAFDKKAKIIERGFGDMRIKTIPLPGRVLNLLWKYGLLPPMDLWLGKGVYIFPNYKNWRLLRSRSLTYIHDLGFIRYPEFVQPKNLAFLKANIRKWIARSTLILTGSDHSRQEIIDLLKVAPDKVVRIYHGVDRQHYHRRSAAEIERVKNKYGIKDKYLLCIGSLEPRKNLQRLIAAYRNLPAKLAGEYALCLAGGGGWLNEPILADIAAAKDEGFKIVRPEQYVSDDDLPALISGATLLVYPALYEGFGLPPLQAMACGTPVVVSDNSSLPEVVGKAGVTVDAENPADITAKMIELLSSAELRRELSKKGLRQAAGFDWDVSARELAACAKRAVNA